MKKLLAYLLTISLASPIWSGTVTTTTGTGSISSTAGTGSITFVSEASAPAGPYTITYDASTFSGNPTGAAGPSITWSQTIGSGTNRFIVVGCATDAGRIITGITVGGNAMTKSTGTYRASAPQPGTDIYTYYNPPSGAQDIVATWSGGGSNSGITCGAISFAGVAATGAVEASTAVYNNDSTPLASLTTITDNAMLVDCVMATGDRTGATVTETGQVKLGATYATSHVFTLMMSTKTVASAGSATMGWTGTSSSEPSDMSVIAIKPGP